MFKASFLCVRVMILIGALVALARGESFPSLPQGFVFQSVGDSWNTPVDIAFLSDGQWLVAEKRGVIWVVENDLKTNSLLDLSTEVLGNADRGLLSIAVDEVSVPNRLFCFYTVDPNSDSDDSEQESFLRLRRYQLTKGEGGWSVDLGTATDLIGSTWESGIPSCHFSHACGSVRFLTDGSLVLGAGDGAHFDIVDAGGLDPGCFASERFGPEQDLGAFRACSLQSPSGKILRIDAETGDGLLDNPFFNGNPSDIESKVYCLGLRNPFRFTLVPNTGPREALLIGDVGWHSCEEIDLALGGEHFGWPCFEGDQFQDDYRSVDPGGFCAIADVEHVSPWLAWSHDDPGEVGFTGRTVTAPLVYNDVAYPEKYRNAVFFCDYATNWIRFARLEPDLSVGAIHPFAVNIEKPVNLLCDPFSGDIVCVGLGSSHRIQRIRFLGADTPPIVIASADPLWGDAPLSVQFDASASIDSEGSALEFHWDFGDGEESADSMPIHSYALEGTYDAILTVTDGEGNASTRPFVITPGNTPPSITKISAPVDGQLYVSGELISLSATVEDLEDDLAGLPLSIAWHIDLVEDHSVHPDWLIVEGESQTFVAQAHGPGTFYRVRLRAGDSQRASVEHTLNLYQVLDPPRPHIVHVTDDSPRTSQVVGVTAHIDWPSSIGPLPDLLWDWGDGTQDRDSGLSHQEDITRQHVYSQEGEFRLHLTVEGNGLQARKYRDIIVRHPRGAVAISYPFFAERRVGWREQETIAEGLTDWLSSRGIEASPFIATSQDALSDWMETYLDDGVQDLLIVLDVVPARVYSGEENGSLAERWLENGNALLHTGDQPFQTYVNEWGLLEDDTAGAFGIDDVLDPTGILLGFGAGFQELQPGAAKRLPSLREFQADRGIRLSRIGVEWRLEHLFTLDPGSNVSDALVIKHDSGGRYAQCYCVFSPPSQRLEVLLQLVETVFVENRTLHAPRSSDKRLGG